MEAGANCEATVLTQKVEASPRLGLGSGVGMKGAGLVIFALGLSGEGKGTRMPFHPALLMTSFPPVKSAHITDAGVEFTGLSIGWGLPDRKQSLLNHRGASSCRRSDHCSLGPLVKEAMCEQGVESGGDQAG